MNNKGQTLLAFVLLLPIFLIFMAFVIDTGYLLKENTKLNSLTKTVLKETQEFIDSSVYKEKIEGLYELNQAHLSELNITEDNNGEHIEAIEKIPSIFGKLIGLNEYEIKVNYRLFPEGNEWKIEKE